MKKNLGKVIFILSIFICSVYAQEQMYCSYKLTSSKAQAMINEPITIKFSTRQKIHDEVMFFDLTAKKSDNYNIVSITDKRYEFNYHDAKKEFLFLIFFKKAGTIKVEFDFKIRTASDDGVAQAYTGGRDNVKSIPTTNIHIANPSIKIEVTALKQKVDAVGKFILTRKIDKNISNAYDSVNVVYTLKGIGFLDNEFEPLKNINDVSIFHGQKAKEPTITRDGYIYEKEWSYALISNSDYNIKQTTLHTFNQKTKNYKKITLKSKKITITKLDTKNLIDKTEYPKDESNYDSYIKYLYNFIIFISGFLASKLTKYIPKQKQKKVDVHKIIKKSKTIKDLLNIIIKSKNHQEIKDEIKNREKEIYYKKQSK